MNEVLREIFHQFIGPNLWQTPESLQDASGSPAQIIASINPSVRVAERLSAADYVRRRGFIVLPSSSNPRWLIPRERASSNALQICTAYAPRARIARRLLAAIIKTGWRWWAKDRAIVASTEPLPLENLVTERTGELSPVFALSCGTPGKFRKLTAQVMRPDGEIIGYIKLPLTAEAIHRVRHEAEILTSLANFPEVSSRIPKILYAGEWCEGYILFQSSGPQTYGPTRFTDFHRAFLTALGRLKSSEKRGSVVAGEVASRWRKAEPLCDSRASSLVQRALMIAGRKLEGVVARCGLGHGDFAPWNTRLEQGGLHVFDWESATWDAPHQWDEFHFYVQVASLLKKKRYPRPQAKLDSEDGVWYLLYLVSSLGQLAEEIGCTSHAGITYRTQEIESILNSRPYACSG
jgi:hypothetical protein